MKTMTSLRFYADGIPGGASTVLDAARCGADVVEILPAFRGDRHLYVVNLDDNDERLSRLLDFLARHGKAPSIVREDVHTEQEFEEARLIVIKAKQELEIDCADGWPAMFDLRGACVNCGTGARQTVPYLMKEEDLPKLEGHRVVTSYWGHILVDDRLVESIVSTGATGLSFHNVYAVMANQRQISVRWKQLRIESVLPRMSVKTTGIHRDRECKICNRCGYFAMAEQPLRIAYQTADLVEALDVNSTWEGFGYSELDEESKPGLLAAPLLLVTPKVWRVFRDAGVTEVDFLPIRVVED